MQGSPLAITVPLVVNGQSADTVSLAAGATESATFTVPRDPATQVMVRLGMLPSLPRTYTGLALATATPLVVTAPLDLTADQRVDATDAALLYYALALPAALGNGNDNNGNASLRRAVLGPLVPGINDAELRERLRVVHTLAVDLNNDKTTDLADAKLLYYAAAFAELGDADAMALRRAILGPLVPGDDAALLEALARARELLN